MISHAPFPLTPALSLGEREARSPLGKKTCDGMGESRFRFSRRPQPAFLLPEGEGQDEGEEASNAQAAFCFLRTHWLGFTHYKRRGTFFSMITIEQAFYIALIMHSLTVVAVNWSNCSSLPI